MHRLKSLVENIEQHNAVNNIFYTTWLEKKLSAKQVAIFARNYFEWTLQFPRALAALISITEDSTARAEHVKTLYSEMGYGNSEKIHSVLFEEFYNQLINKLAPNEALAFTDVLESVTLLPETIKLTSWERETYAKDEAAAVGAQLALEWQAYTMIRKLYEGTRNYKDLWDNQDEFHEACEFFYAHIGQAEKEHKEQSLTAAGQVLKTDDDYKKIRSGFEQHLLLIGNFWHAIVKDF